MPIHIANDMVACEPFPSVSIEKVGSTFVVAKNKTALIGLKVVYGSVRQFAVGQLPGHPYSPESIIYVRGDVTTMPWAREKMTLGGKEVILVPCHLIQAWEL